MKFQIMEEVIDKFYNFNQAQTNPGSELKTVQKGSSIKRYSKTGVGKYISSQLYFHKNYAKDVFNDMTIYNQCLQLVEDQFPDFVFNCICYAPKNGTISFQEGSNFNTASEPEVGLNIVVDYQNMIIKSAKVQHQIWHHKWLWVKNDYTDFDVAESWEWSKLWLSTLDEPANGSNESNWKEQLAKFSILDEWEKLNNG